MKMVLQRYSVLAKLKFNFALEWNIVKTDILLISHPKTVGVQYPHNTSLVIAWLWSSDYAGCLLPDVFQE